MAELERRICVANFKLEKRLYEGDEPGEGKEDKGLPKIVGYAAIFNSLSEDLGGFREQISPGAFREAIETSEKVKALVDHNPSMVIGSTPNTLRMIEDDRGLLVEIDTANTTSGRDIVESIDRGDVDSMSFAFTCSEEGATWEENSEGVLPIRTIRNIVELFDVSPVTYPAYKSTDVVVAQRSLSALRAKAVEEAVVEEKTEEITPEEAIEPVVEPTPEEITAETARNAEVSKKLAQKVQENNGVLCEPWADE